MRGDGGRGEWVEDPAAPLPDGACPPPPILTRGGQERITYLKAETEGSTEDWTQKARRCATTRLLPVPAVSAAKNRARRAETLRKSLGNAGSYYRGALLCLRGLGRGAASECLCPPTFLQQNSHLLERKVQHLEQGNDLSAGGGGLVICSHSDSSCSVCTECLLCASSGLCSGAGRVTRERTPPPLESLESPWRDKPSDGGRAGKRSCQGGGGRNPAEVTWKGVRRDAARLRPVAGGVGQGDAAPRALGRERGECPGAQSSRAVRRKLGWCPDAHGRLAGAEEQATGQGCIPRKKKRKADDVGSRWATWRNLGGQGWGQ